MATNKYTSVYANGDRLPSMQKEIEDKAFRRQLAVSIVSGLVNRKDYLSEDTAYSDFAEEVWKLAWAVAKAEESYRND